MTDVGGASQVKGNGLKKKSPNLSSGWVVMLLSGLVAAVIFLAVTQQGSSHYSVLVAAHDIKTGDKISSSDFEAAEVNVDQAQLNRLIVSSDAKTYDGYVATGPISRGDLVTKSQLRESSGKDGMRSMALPVDKAHAVNGNLATGDRIDIIDEVSGAYVVTDIEILSADSKQGNSLGGGSSFEITIAVDSEQAAKVSKQLKTGAFDIVRATGAEPLDSVTNTTLPGSST